MFKSTHSLKALDVNQFFFFFFFKFQNESGSRVELRVRESDLIFKGPGIQ